MGTIDRRRLLKLGGMTAAGTAASLLLPTAAGAKVGAERTPPGKAKRGVAAEPTPTPTPTAPTGGMPNGQVYRALDKLVERGLATGTVRGYVDRTAPDRRRHWRCRRAGPIGCGAGDVCWTPREMSTAG